MSTNQEDLIRTLAGQNPDFASAMQHPPPNASGLKKIPVLDNVGLDLFKPHMTEAAFDTFITIVHWCILQQKIATGQTVEYTHETFAAMAAATRGFGNSFIWENEYRGNVGKFLDLFHMNWYQGGPRYREQNPLPHKFIKEVAPMFANTSKGWNHSEMVADLVNDPNTYKLL